MEHQSIFRCRQMLLQVSPQYLYPYDKEQASFEDYERDDNMKSYVEKGNIDLCLASTFVPAHVFLLLKTVIIVE